MVAKPRRNGVSHASRDAPFRASGSRFQPLHDKAPDQLLELPNSGPTLCLNDPVSAPKPLNL